MPSYTQMIPVQTLNQSLMMAIQPSFQTKGNSTFSNTVLVLNQMISIPNQINSDQKVEIEDKSQNIKRWGLSCHWIDLGAGDSDWIVSISLIFNFLNCLSSQESCLLAVLLKKIVTCLKCIKFGILEGNLIKPVHEASHVSQPFLTRRHVSQPFLTRRQEVKTCQPTLPVKKNSQPTFPWKEICQPTIPDKKTRSQDMSVNFSWQEE